MEISRAAMRKLMLLIAFAILLFTGLQHFGQVLAFLRFVGGVASPLLIGGAVAFVLNVPRSFSACWRPSLWWRWSFRRCC